MSGKKQQYRKHRILVVDDETDVHQVVRLSLRCFRFRGMRLELLFAESGRQAVRIMKDDPDIAVILLDVVMESNTAGLDACIQIREELANKMVRILIFSGTGGSIGENSIRSSYDINGYLAKAETTLQCLALLARYVATTLCVHSAGAPV